MENSSFLEEADAEVLNRKNETVETSCFFLQDSQVIGLGNPIKI